MVALMSDVCQKHQEEEEEDSSVQSSLSWLVFGEKLRLNKFLRLLFVKALSSMKF